MHNYLTVDVEMDNLIKLRTEINKTASTKISIQCCSCEYYESAMSVNVAMIVCDASTYDLSDCTLTV